MATILIKPVKTRTTGNYKAQIIGIDPTDEDCLIGIVKTKQGKSNQKWNKSGICRDNTDKLNLLTKKDCLSEIIELINTLQK